MRRWSRRWRERPAADRLELEITESLLMSNTEQVVGSCTRCRRMGVRIAMDDFGTGYSSLAYLWRFPFDKVKIDRAFTQHLRQRPQGRPDRALHHLAGALAATSASTPRAWRPPPDGALQEHGCDELQGFLLGRPQPAHKLSHDNVASGPPARPEASESAFVGLPTMPAPL